MSAIVPSASPIVQVERKDLITYVGNRIRVVLDDDSVLTGKLVSLSASGNLILTDVERERPLKRKRGADGTTRQHARVCYGSVLFVRGSSVVTVAYSGGVTSDKHVVDCVGARTEVNSRTIQIAGIAPSVPL